MSQLIYKNGCWNCLKAQQDPTEKYICPKYHQHLKDCQKEKTKLEKWLKEN